MNEFPQTLKLVTVWLLIILAVWLGVQWFQWQRAQSRFEQFGGDIVLRRAPDGHFHWPATVHGVAVEFLVDTGATTTALPAAVAEAAGLVRGAPVRSSTAGGEVWGYESRADLLLQGGLRVQRLRVTVLPDLASPLLGMDILGRLHLTQRQGELRIESAEPAPR
ncbi:MAG TPA: TIGR02281 family clan AA aspartic protease [Burkholderiaceae bacterium]|nr:TIGR02281 family clan AA aspartic protease [Burkholderiaceae bacterium]HMZ01752.1 TIGR02281 family clan AA aspartic protease [Burkholderiaceae bacterium]HNB43891.1 TIGR02281 family clan AA aspartic protease [Burkholderiaceae bacterium]HNG79248.1 TIGR02281 family clan AA aspartic protease [Burkholderiaceae bacterium]